MTRIAFRWKAAFNTPLGAGEFGFHPKTRGFDSSVFGGNSNFLKKVQIFFKKYLHKVSKGDKIPLTFCKCLVRLCKGAERLFLSREKKVRKSFSRVLTRLSGF
jgi:hypothetical protein